MILNEKKKNRYSDRRLKCLEKVLLLFGVMMRRRWESVVYTIQTFNNCNEQHFANCLGWFHFSKWLFWRWI